ncbi:MAG: c-type cytochrome [Myxococcota bacterium]
MSEATPEAEAKEAEATAEAKASETTSDSSRGRRAILAAILTVGFVGGIALSLAHCTRSRPQDARDAQLVAGGQDYRTYCGLCHGDEGEGYTADNANALANQDFLVSVTDDFLRENIAEGHPGTPMAAYAQRRGGPLSDTEIDQLVAYIRAWQTEPTAELPEPGEGNAERGAPVYAERCASCHGDEGQGVSAVSLNNPRFLASASDAQVRYAIAHGRRGTPMPAFEGDLQDQTIDDLVAVIRGWQREATTQDIETPSIEGDVVINPDGDAPDFGELREGRYVPAALVAQALEDGNRMVLLDARPASDYALFHAPGAVPAPYYDIANVMARIPNDGTWAIAYCACPHAASGRVMNYLREHGYPNTAVIDEGIIHWRDEGYPIVTGSDPGSLETAE